MPFWVPPYTTVSPRCHTISFYRCSLMSSKSPGVLVRRAFHECETNHKMINLPGVLVVELVDIDIVCHRSLACVLRVADILLGLL